MWTQILLDRVRIHKKSIQREYRCDSTNAKRFMLMEVTPEEQNQLKLTHKTMSVVPLKVPFKPVVTRNWQLEDLIRCCLCNRVKSDNVWKEPDELTDNDGDPTPVIYTVCENCKNKDH